MYIHVLACICRYDSISLASQPLGPPGWVGGAGLQDYMYDRIHIHVAHVQSHSTGANLEEVDGVASHLYFTCSFVNNNIGEGLPLLASHSNFGIVKYTCTCTCSYLSSMNPVE